MKQKSDEDLAKLNRLFELFKTAPPELQQKVLGELDKIISGETHAHSKELFIEIKQRCAELQREVSA